MRTRSEGGGWAEEASKRAGLRDGGEQQEVLSVASGESVGERRDERVSSPRLGASHGDGDDTE